MAIVDHLSTRDVVELASAARGGAAALQRLRASCGSAVVRRAVDDVVDLLGSDGHADLAGLLIGASTMRARCEERQRLEVVWTGPDVSGGSHRLTAAVLAELIESASREVLLVGFAVHSEPSVVAALSGAASRGVEITLLLERTEDNAGYSSGGGGPFPDLSARRLAWPADQRPSTRSSLHAKVLVVDRRVALVTSANITHSALHANIECGVVVHDVRAARSIAGHVDALVDAGSLVDA